MPGTRCTKLSDLRTFVHAMFAPVRTGFLEVTQLETVCQTLFVCVDTGVLVAADAPHTFLHALYCSAYFGLFNAHDVGTAPLSTLGKLGFRTFEIGFGVHPEVVHGFPVVDGDWIVLVLHMVDQVRLWTLHEIAAFVPAKKTFLDYSGARAGERSTIPVE